MKRLVTIFLLLTNVALAAQPVVFLEQDIKVGNKKLVGLSAYIETSPSKLAAAWNEYVATNLSINLSKSNETFEAKEVKFSSVTTKTSDVYTIIDVKNNGAQMSVSIALGYDLCLNSSNHPEDFERFRNFMSTFISKYINEEYNAVLQQKQAQANALKREIDFLESDVKLKNNTKSNAYLLLLTDAQKNLESTKKITAAKRSGIAQKNDNIDQLRNEIGKIYNQQKTFRNNEKTKFKSDLTQYKGKAKHSLSGFSTLQPNEVGDAWIRYVKTNLLVEVEKEADIFYESQQVQLVGITDKDADLIALIEPYGGGTKISVAVSPGYDLSINSKDNPKEFNALRKFLNGFTSEINHKISNEDLSPGDKAKLDYLFAEVVKSGNQLHDAKKDLASSVQDSITAEELIKLVQLNIKNNESITPAQAKIDKKAELNVLESEIANYQLLMSKSDAYLKKPQPVYKNTASSTTIVDKSNTAVVKENAKETPTKPVVNEKPVLNNSTVANTKKEVPTKGNTIITNTTEVKTVPTAPKTPKYTTYMVKKGDTVKSIADKFGMSVIELKRVNGLSTNQLYINDKLTVWGAN